MSRIPKHEFTLKIRGVVLDAIVEGELQDHEIKSITGDVWLAIEAGITLDELITEIEEKFKP